MVRRALKELMPRASGEMVCLDVLRVVAAFMVVIYHFNAKIEWPAGGIGWPRHFSAAVDLFFFISGYVITRFYGGVSGARVYRAFLAKRVARLYPLHLATALCFVAIGATATIAHLQLRIAEQFDTACLPANLLLLNSTGLCPHLSFNDVSWSISAETLLYIALPVLLLLRRLGRWAAPLAALLVFTALEVLAPPGSPDPWYLWTFDGGWLRAIPSFLLGAAAYDYRGLIGRLPAGEGAMWVTLVFGLIAAPFLGYVPFMLLLFAAVVFAIASDQKQRVSVVSRALAPWSTLTYSIYMLHGLIDVVGLSLIARKLLHLTGAAMDIAVVVGMVATCVLAIISYNFLEKPARRWLTEKLTGKLPRRVPAADMHGPL